MRVMAELRLPQPPTFTSIEAERRHRKQRLADLRCASNGFA